LYLGENKKETNKWFQAQGHRVPMGGTKYGFIRSIAQKNSYCQEANEPSTHFLLANALEGVAQNNEAKRRAS
jgi:hypothetical protein